MIRVHSLKRRIAVQFLIIVAPIAIVLVAQTILEVRRSANLQAAFLRAKAANQAHVSFKKFVDGVVDAVDTGSIAASVAIALDTTSAAFMRLESLTSIPDAPTLKAGIASLNESLARSSAIADFRPHYTTVDMVRARLELLVGRYDGEEHAAIEAAVSVAETQKWILLAAILASLGCAAFFVTIMIRGDRKSVV